MAGTLAALFVAAIGQTVVATALPAIVADLGNLDLLAWVFTSYLLTSTIVVLVAGKLGDQFGRKPLFLLAIVCFSAGSAASGLSQSMGQLIIFRAVQGVGGGMLFATSFAVVGDLYAPLERGRIQGLFAGVFGLASVVGPTLGGWVTDSVTWRWVFYLNLPVAVAAFLIILWGMPWVRPLAGQRPKVDVIGVVLISAVLVPLLLALALGGNQYPWRSREIVQLFGSSAVMLALFIVAERDASEPSLPLSLFRDRTFVVSALVTFLVGAGMFGAITMVPLFLQGVTGIAATNSGTLMMPMMLSMVSAAAVGGQLMTRTGRYKWLAVYGGVATAAALLLFSTVDANTSRLEMVRNMVLLGFALGPSLPVFTVAVQNALPFEMLGVATAGSQFFRQMGGTVGVAVFTTLMLNRFRDGMAEVAGSVPAIAASPNALLSADAVERVRTTYESTAVAGAEPFDAILSVVRFSLGRRDRVHLPGGHGVRGRGGGDHLRAAGAGAARHLAGRDDATHAGGAGCGRRGERGPRSRSAGRGSGGQRWRGDGERARRRRERPRRCRRRGTERAAARPSHPQPCRPRARRLRRRPWRRPLVLRTGAPPSRTLAMPPSRTSRTSRRGAGGLATI